MDIQSTTYVAMCIGCFPSGPHMIHHFFKKLTLVKRAPHVVMMNGSRFPQTYVPLRETWHDALEKQNQSAPENGGIQL